jgi:hypothetical protein
VAERGMGDEVDQSGARDMGRETQRSGEVAGDLEQALAQALGA